MGEYIFRQVKGLSEKTFYELRDFYTKHQDSILAISAMGTSIGAGILLHYLGVRIPVGNPCNDYPPYTCPRLHW